jgi:predicted PurR-regulated permease PerM
MTATTVAARAQPTRAESKPGAPLLVAGELALTGYTLAVVIGFARIFDKWAFFGPLALAAAAAHLLAIAARRLRLNLAASSVLSLFGLVVLGAVLFYASTTNHGMGRVHRSARGGLAPLRQRRGPGVVRWW